MVVAVLLATSTAVFVAGVLILWFLLRMAGSHRYDYLVEPRITAMPDRHVIEVLSHGDADDIGEIVFPVLIRLYHKLRHVPKYGRRMPFPMARWSNIPGERNSNVTCRAAIEVPETISALPDVNIPEDVICSITTWEYGKVAEILHVGPQNDRQRTLEHLERFILEQGMTRADLWHEEVYIRGPFGFFHGDPASFRTLIRWHIRSL